MSIRNRPRLAALRAPSRRSLIAGGALAALAAGIVLAALLSNGESPRQPSAPTPAAPRVPAHNAPSSPPWGVSGSAWSDYCYRTTGAPPEVVQGHVLDSQPCAKGTIRVTGIRQIDATARAGADADRLGAAWGTIQPRAPDQPVPEGETRFDWEPLVRRYRAMLDAGIRPVVVAGGTPIWARAPDWDRPGECPVPGEAGCVFPPTPSHIAAWRDFLRRLMVRLPRMRALEVWNEPNSARFFAPQPSPALYVRLLRAAGEAARQVGFKRPIITGGLAPERPPNPGKVPPARFLSRVYELAGRSAFDGVGAHPYPAGPPWVANMEANLHQLRAVEDRFHDGGKPLWITEVGIGGTPRGRGRYDVPLGRQGPVLGRMYRAVQGGGVRAFIVYNLYDAGAGGSRFGPYSIMRANLAPKPAYCYLARHLGRIRACPPGS